MENKFKKYPDYEIQIKNFMNNIIDMVLFDFLTMNNDRHSDNWYIKYNKLTFELVDLFDHDHTFSNSFYSKLNSQHYQSIEAALKELILESDDVILNRFIEFLNKIKPNKISKLIRDIIDKNNLNIYREKRNEIVFNYNRNYTKLKNIINYFLSLNTNKLSLKQSNKHWFVILYSFFYFFEL